MGGAGEGAEFGADLHYLFMAGKVHMPRVARTYNDLAQRTFDFRTRLNSISSELQSPTGFAGLKDARDDLQVALYKTAVNVDEAADALVQIAERYATTDSDAQEEFNRQRGQLHGRDAVDADGPDWEPTPPS